MATSKFASYETGYDDERFEQIVSQTLHCIICTNVIKDPVMCRHNEHVFCRGCITRHLMYSQTCPTCMEPLTVDTLKVPRNIANLLSELKIRCEFFDRGCERFILLGDLEKHVEDCGFAPAVCSNEGCNFEANKRDLLHHETAVCELRRVQCHSCNELRREVDAVKSNLAMMSEKMDKNEKIFLEKIETNGKAVTRAVVNDVLAKVELVQKQLDKQEGSIRQLCNTGNDEMKRKLDEVNRQLQRMAWQTALMQLPCDVQVEQEQLKKGIGESNEIDKDKVKEPKVIIAGGKDLNSVEIFDLANKTWKPRQPMREIRKGASSVVHNNDIIILGGCHDSMEKLSIDVLHVDLSVTWESVLAKLPGRFHGQCTVVHNGHLVVIGGFDLEKKTYSKSITKISLVPPYTRKPLSTTPQERCYHGVAIFSDRILIAGGRKSHMKRSALISVVMYNITKNEYQEMAPLPYPVSQMATVKWGEDNVILMGGVDSNDEVLSKVLIFNIKTQKSHMLPNMKYKREGCVAAVVRDTVIVMGGRDERGNALKSVESFRFDRYSWEELPDMHEARYKATAVVC
ncbi:uncharacterized protein LOC114534447 [Dendronephthya gigantea]|uniref:uncharacterized protein LOC114534447 n=1 Tax=Dendronephthya gigantea TaxID=151771 RepID=UPI00106A95FC|nr:uncharacterized protein LOC114534447 [Dendronephthya gigantea]